MLAMFAIPETAHAQRGSSNSDAIALPQVIGPARRGEIKDLEAANPGLGQVVSYQWPGWRTTVFIYDLRRRDLPDTADASEIVPQLQQAAGDIATLKQRGDYAAVDEGLAFTVPDGSAARFHCKSFVLKSPAGVGGVQSRTAEFDSYVCVTTWRRQFVKVRLTAPRAPQSPRDALAFVTALDRALAP